MATKTEQELLRAAGRGQQTALHELYARYGQWVLASATRRLGSPADALTATRGVFLVLARRARRLRTRKTLAPWLFAVTRLACARLRPTPGRWRSFFHLRSRPPAMPLRELKADESGEGGLRSHLTPFLDEAIDRLRPRRREAVLLHLWGHSTVAMAALLGINEHRATRRLECGLHQLATRLRRRGVAISPTELRELVPRLGENTPGSAEFAESLSLVPEGGDVASPGPAVALARGVLRTLAWARWRRRILIGVPTLVLGLIILLAGLWTWDARTGHSRVISMFFVWSVQREARTVPGLAQPARDWPAAGEGSRLTAAGVESAADLYRRTNTWLAHLVFSPSQWTALEPERIDPLPHFLQPDGTALLRNPLARRSGLAGALGFDFPWSSADLEFGERRFTNVAVRIKGNGTYLGSLYGEKRAYKVDLNRLVRGQKLGGADELNFNNLVNDHSFMSDALGYEFFRDAGVPAPRTAYAYLSVTVTGESPRKPLGLYAMIEPVDSNFALDRMGSRRAPIFKPVTYELFKYLGNDWAPYDSIYDLKTEATENQRRRLIEFARLVSEAEADEFARRLPEFLDLEAFAAFLACQVILSNYDSLLSTGQNFYLYLDPVSNRFGFIPWDLDLAWGGFFLLGSVGERERASLWHPWVGSNRFLERVLSVDAFRSRYRATLEALLGGLFRPERLHAHIDEMAAVVRGPVTAESDFRRRKFDQAVGDRKPEPAPNEFGNGAHRPAHVLKRFVTNRAKSVRQQLDGTSDGVVLRRRAME